MKTSEPEMPKPLADPLRKVRLLFGTMILLDIGAFIFWLQVANPGSLSQGSAALFLFCASAASALPLTVWAWSILPRRTVNAFYLRSFRNDALSWPMRKAAQEALGRGFRLSGIRDPRKRWSVVFRYLHVILFALRYCTPRFMNLEAGADWKLRLWRSLGEARCALIDVSDMTAFVVEEIFLCFHCLGLRRILFIDDASRDPDALRGHVVEFLPWLDPEVTRAIRVAVWHDSVSGRKAFAESVREFVEALPPGNAGTNLDALPIAQPPKYPEGGQSAWEGEGWGVLLLAFVVGLVIQIGYGFFQPSGKWLAPLWRLPTFTLIALELVMFAEYFTECTSRNRVIAAASLTFSVLWLIVIQWISIMVPAINRSECYNNLKHIALGMHSYHDEMQTLPPAAAPVNFAPGAGSRRAVSWRVRILPYLDCRELYGQYRLDEPWDGPNNVKLIPRMPKVFVVPGTERMTPPGHTYFRVFASPLGSSPKAAFDDFDPQLPNVTGVPLAAFSDGASNTILVVEAAEAVPWTKPEELVYDSKKPLPALGGHFRGGFFITLGDGSSMFIPSEIEDRFLRALITRNGDDSFAP